MGKSLIMKNANQIKLAKELLHLAKSLMALKPDDHGPVIPETKKEFLDLLLSRINRIEYSVSIVEDDSSRQAAKHKPVKRHRNKYPSTSSDIKDDNLSELVGLKAEFEELKKKIPEWLNEGTHNQSFYGVDFIKRLLESGCNIVFVPRPDDPSKMDPERYGLENPENFRKTILKKISTNQLMFLENTMGTRDEFPLDV